LSEKYVGKKKLYCGFIIGTCFAGNLVFTFTGFKLAPMRDR